MSNIKKSEWFPQLSQVFDDYLSKDLWNWGLNNNSVTNTTIPAVNIKETQETFEVEMAAPGMTKNDFAIELDGNTLIISSEKENQNEQKEGERYTKREFSYQSFYRTFQLQKDVMDIQNIQASYEN